MSKFAHNIKIKFAARFFAGMSSAAIAALAILAGCRPAAPVLPSPTPASATAAPVLPSSMPSLATATSAPQKSQTFIYMIAIEDNGKSGKPVGCGDSLIAVPVELPAGEDPVKAALNGLFSIKDQVFGESGLYNSLYQSNLAVDSIEIDTAGKATVKIKGETQLGGVCDNPRFEAQILETILQFPQINEAFVFINDVPLSYIVSGK